MNCLRVSYSLSLFLDLHDDIIRMDPHPDEVELKIETDIMNIIEPKTEITKRSNVIEIDVEEGPSKKRSKLDYISDNSQSQPSVDMNIELGIKEHGSKVRI